VRKYLREDFYAVDFEALVERWGRCIIGGGGHVEKNVFFFRFKFEYHMFYVLYPFVTYLLTLPRSYGSRVPWVRLPAHVSHGSCVQLELVICRSCICFRRCIPVITELLLEHITRCLLTLLVCPENGGSASFRIVGTLLPHDTALEPRRKFP
jgi:hypothetical protein